MDKVWLKNYQPGVPAEIDINQFQSVSEVFARSVERFRDRPAMANMGKVYTYGELDALTVRFASFLQNTLKLPMGPAPSGVRVGEHIAGRCGENV